MSFAVHRVAFGDRLRDLRRQRGWASQEAFAHHAGLDRTYVSGLERGARNPTLDMLIRLATALEIEPAELLATIPSTTERDVAASTRD